MKEQERNGKSGPLLGEGGFNTICIAVCNRRDSITAYRLSRLEPSTLCIHNVFCIHSGLVGVEPITTVIRSGRARWYGHVTRKCDEDWVKKCMELS